MHSSGPHKINPSALSNEGEQILGPFLASEKTDFIKSKEKYFIFGTDISFTLTHNLIIDKEYHEKDEKRYFIISKDPDDVLGAGGKSKVRRMLGSSLIVNIETKLITYEETLGGKGVRITNTKEARQTSSAPYSHGKAIANYNTSKIFDYLGMQPPIRVYRQDNNGFFKKSYAVINAFEGQDLQKEVKPFLKKRPSIKEVIDMVIVPVLLAYKDQIAKRGYAHRDIKPANIRFWIRSAEKASVAHFIDLDFSLKIGLAETNCGSVGYMPPEFPTAIYQLLEVNIARDIFALGMALHVCFNPSLDPREYFTAKFGDQVKTLSQFLLRQTQEIRKHGYYAVDDKKLFRYVSDASSPASEKARRDIKSILKEMTNLSPGKRPNNMDQLIDRFKVISSLLTPTIPSSIPFYHTHTTVAAPVTVNANGNLMTERECANTPF